MQEAISDAKAINNPLLVSHQLKSNCSYPLVIEANKRSTSLIEQIQQLQLLLLHPPSKI